MSGQLNYCNVARDSVLKVVIIIRSSNTSGTPDLIRRRRRRRTAPDPGDNVVAVTNSKNLCSHKQLLTSK
jgi:hypothetical protein